MKWGQSVSIVLLDEENGSTKADMGTFELGFVMLLIAWERSNYLPWERLFPGRAPSPTEMYFRLGGYSVCVTFLRTPEMRFLMLIYPVTAKVWTRWLPEQQTNPSASQVLGWVEVILALWLTRRKCKKICEILQQYLTHSKSSLDVGWPYNLSSSMIYQDTFESERGTSQAGCWDKRYNQDCHKQPGWTVGMILASIGHGVGFQAPVAHHLRVWLGLAP